MVPAFQVAIPPPVIITADPSVPQVSKGRLLWRPHGLGKQNEAGQRLIEFGKGNALVIANILFQQHKRRLYTWTSPDGQHRNQIDYIL